MSKGRSTSGQRGLPATNHWVAFLVVGLGMVLIAGLAGVGLWAMTRRKAALPAKGAEPETLATSETAEA